KNIKQIVPQAVVRIIPLLKVVDQKERVAFSGLINGVQPFQDFDHVEKFVFLLAGQGAFRFVAQFLSCILFHPPLPLNRRTSAGAAPAMIAPTRSVATRNGSSSRWL